MQHLLSRRRRLLAAGLLLPWCTGALAAAPAKGTPARRIVVAGGALTEIVYALGAEHELVGVDTTSLFPAQAQRLPSVGYARALSAEGVLSLRPTLLLATREAGPPAVLAQLQAARVQVETLALNHRFEGVLAAVQRVAALCQRPAQGQALQERLQADWAAALQRVAQRSTAAPPRVLFVLSHSMAQVRVAGRDTAAHAVIGLAGAHNAFGEVSGYRPLTPEAAVAAAPEVILCTDQGLQAAGGVEGLLRAPGLAATPAGRAGQVLTLDALLLLGFGPRLPQAVTQLSDLLHPRA